MAVCSTITFKEFRQRFATEEDCRNPLFKERFSDGFVCPRCGNRGCYFIHTRNLCQCKLCRHQTSVTAGTVMHRTHLPLTVWFWAIYLCATDKRGISAVSLSQKLDISYESAWYLLKRIRSAMAQRDSRYKLSGLIEMDETYLGGPDEGGKRGRGTTRPIMEAALSKEGFLHLQLIGNVTTAALQKVVDEHILPHSSVISDGFRSYQSLKNVSVTSKKYECGDLKWIHIVISNFKSFIMGTYHGRCRNYQAYMDEFCFRFNRRHWPNQLFPRLVRAVATSGAMLS